MVVTFGNGQSVRAVILAREENEIRAALEGSEDTTRFINVNGTWVSDECEPVGIEFHWQRRIALPTPEEAECICPKDMAAKLIRLLHYGEREEDEASAMAFETPAGTRAYQIV